MELKIRLSAHAEEMLMRLDGDVQVCSPRIHSQIHRPHHVAFLFPQVHRERTHHPRSMLELALADGLRPCL